MSEQENSPAPAPTEPAQSTPVEETQVSEEKKSVTQPEPPKVNPVFVGGGLVLIAAILFVVFGMRSKPTSYDTPIPYIFNRRFLGELTVFAEQPHHKEVLVFHGARGVGKTRGLRQFIEKLNGEDRLAVNFDFQMLTKSATPRDLMDYLASAVIKSVQKLDGKQIRTGELRHNLVLADAVTTVEGRLLREIPIPVKDYTLQRILRALLTIIEKIGDSPEASVRGLLEAIDALAPLKPIVIVNNIENLNESVDDVVLEFAKAFVKVCDDFAKDYRALGVIFEVSDESVLLDGIGLNAIRLRSVEEFSPEDAQAVLVNSEFFNKATFQAIKDKFGGNGQNYATVHDLTREQMTLSEAFEHIEKEWRCTILAAIDGRFNEENFLRGLSQQRMLPVASNIAAAKNLLKGKVLTLVNATHCQYANKFVERTTQAILK